MGEEFADGPMRSARDRLQALRAVLFLPLVEPRSGFGTGVQFNRLQESQWWGRHAIEALQTRKLDRLLTVATSSTRHYEGAAPVGRSVDASPRGRLSRWPILRKADIRRSPGSFRTAPSRGWLAQCTTTGGTTGDPIEVWRDHRCVAVSEAARWRGLGWSGILPWDRGILVRLAGASWYGRLRMRITRKWKVEAFCASPEKRMRIEDLIRQVRPRYLDGFVTDLCRLGEAVCLEPGLVGCVVTTGEMLYPRQRSELESRFGARVVEYYGSNEVGSLAFECEYGVRHVTDEHVIVETLDEAGQPVIGSPGRIVVTDLDNTAMPLVRYELGDRGVLSNERCQCGRSLTILKELLGRTQGVLRNRAGETLSETFFAVRFREQRGVRRFQLRQLTLDEIELHYEVAQPGAELDVDEIRGEIGARLGPEVVVRAVEVAQLSTTHRGKCPLVVGLG